VATVYVRRPPFFLRRHDVGLEMLRRGLAVAYEGKMGAEFGGPEMEEKYRAAVAMAKEKKKGMWAAKGATKESPMEYKRRMKSLEKAAGTDGKG
jgi:endonuclease YncB( thermonuclease family)